MMDVSNGQIYGLFAIIVLADRQRLLSSKAVWSCNVQIWQSESVVATSMYISYCYLCICESSTSCWQSLNHWQGFP